MQEMARKWNRKGTSLIREHVSCIRIGPNCEQHPSSFTLDQNAGTICPNYKTIRMLLVIRVSSRGHCSLFPPWPEVILSFLTTKRSPVVHGTHLPVEDKYMHFSHFQAWVLDTHWAGPFVPCDWSWIYKFCLRLRQALKASSFGLLSVGHSLLLSGVHVFILWCVVFKTALSHVMLWTVAKW